MKKIFLFLTATLPALLYAQFDVKFDESARPFSKGTYPSYQFELKQSHLQQTEKDWMEYLHKGSKGKPVSVNGEISITGAVSENVWPAPFNVYSTLLETTTGLRITAWVSLNNDSVFVSNALPDRNLAVEKYLHDFAAAEYRVIVKNELDEESAKLKKLQNELEDYYHDQDAATKKSNRFKRSIDRNRNKIQINEADQRNKEDQIQRQKMKVEDLKAYPGPELDAAKKAQRDYEKDLNKLVNKKERLHKQIDRWEAKIRAQGRNTSAALAGQNEKKALIEKQKLVVSAVQAKLDDIR